MRDITVEELLDEKDRYIGGKMVEYSNYATPHQREIAQGNITDLGTRVEDEDEFFYVETDTDGQLLSNLSSTYSRMILKTDGKYVNAHCPLMRSDWILAPKGKPLPLALPGRGEQGLN